MSFLRFAAGAGATEGQLHYGRDVLLATVSCLHSLRKRGHLMHQHVSLPVSIRTHAGNYSCSGPKMATAVSPLEDSMPQHPKTGFLFLKPKQTKTKHTTRHTLFNMRLSKPKVTRKPWTQIKPHATNTERITSDTGRDTHALTPEGEAWETEGVLQK